VEIRLCTIAGTRWLESVAPDRPLPKVPRGLGPSFQQLVEKGARELGTGSALRDLPLEGLVVAFVGPRFQDPELIASVAHAAASANILAGRGAQPQARELESFVSGDGRYGEVSTLLRPVGVYSWIEGSDALGLGEWLQRVDATNYEAEVADMHGRENAPVYQAVLRDLTTVLKSVSVHGCDLCCLD
jgi:hypothetical protein